MGIDGWMEPGLTQARAITHPSKITQRPQSKSRNTEIPKNLRIFNNKPE
jgi:hypothetical protein